MILYYVMLVVIHFLNVNDSVLIFFNIYSFQSQLVNKMEQCVHSTQMSLFPAKVNSGITPEQIMVMSKFEFGLPFMVPDLVYKFQMICIRGNKTWISKLVHTTRFWYNLHQVRSKSKYLKEK